MIAERFATILPRLNAVETLEVYAIRQAAGLPDPPSPLPPLRSPHHTLTPAGLIGGTNQLSPGEVTLAHHGVLLLDELLEFRRATLEALREPLVNKAVRLARGGRTAVLPADFVLIGTLNPCPCGHRGFGECRCTDLEVSRYWSRLSGPLLDRIDLTVYVRPVPADASTTAPPTSEDIRGQVEQARQRLEQPIPWQPEAKALAGKAAARLRLSKRAEQAVVRVAESICALSQREQVGPEHVQEALALRSHAHPLTFPASGNRALGNRPPQLHMSTAPRR
ncbi:MAG: ATP-binding protein [Alicyclobacillus sp.]|nr:ATP-binding protein [Alicyclobacillus sp.]